MNKKVTLYDYKWSMENIYRNKLINGLSKLPNVTLDFPNPDYLAIHNLEYRLGDKIKYPHDKLSTDLLIIHVPEELSIYLRYYANRFHGLPIARLMKEVPYQEPQIGHVKNFDYSRTNAILNFVSNELGLNRTFNEEYNWKQRRLHIF